MRKPAPLFPALDTTLKRLSLASLLLGAVLGVCWALVAYLAPVSRNTDCAPHTATAPPALVTPARSADPEPA